MSSRYDVLVIGAGILGCFAARSLRRYELNIAVLEKREDVCTGITRANTGIIYQGYDQHPGSLKAEMCRRASVNFPSLCRELGVRYRKTGLMMLSYGPRGNRVLEKKLANAEQAGIEGVSIIGRDRIAELEPALAPGAERALFARHTYTADPWELGIAAFENARANGVPFFFNEEAAAIRRDKEGFTVETVRKVYHTKKLLICGGLHADSLWNTAGRPGVKLIPRGADYLVFDTHVGNTLSRIISVEPETGGEGLTLVPTADGNILAGPTKRGCSGITGYPTESAGLDELTEKCRQLVPGLPADMIIRSFGAVRPNPYYMDEDGNISDKSINDFLILEDDGLFGLIGVKTPGITCANELGLDIADRIARSFKDPPRRNRDFRPERTGITRTAELMKSDPAALAALPAEYHEIVCRCMKVSRGEILEAVSRGASTVNGIRRRTGAGMGRCQGGYCEAKILHILSESLGKEIYEVTKDGAGSEILLPGKAKSYEADRRTDQRG